MRKCVIIFIFLLSFSGAYCQSQIISNTIPNNPPPLQLSPGYQPGNNVIRRLDEGEGAYSPAANYRRSNPSFQPGILITRDGDTLSGLIKYGYPFTSGTVIYRTALTAADSIFSFSNVKSIITQSLYLSNIPFNGKEEMMPWLAVGKINLYSHTKYFSTSADITFVLEKNKNQFVYINKKNFKVMMNHVFFDTPDMLKKIGKKGYKFEDMGKIIKEYNRRFEPVNSTNSESK
jgi:hypothetical protein